MKYFYYPGCSLEGTAMEYNGSTKAVMEAVGAELVELEDWTCCGASAVDNMSHLLSMVLPARNLALAEKTGASLDFLIPCSACYLNFKKVEENIAQDDRMFYRPPRRRVDRTFRRTTDRPTRPGLGLGL